MAPKVPTAFCVCPDGNEYPVAAARGFDDRTARVEHPRPGNTAENFEKLVGERTEQTHYEYIISHALVDAPE